MMESKATAVEKRYQELLENTRRPKQRLQIEALAMRLAILEVDMYYGGTAVKGQENKDV